MGMNRRPSLEFWIWVVIAGILIGLATQCLFGPPLTNAKPSGSPVSDEAG